jgi:hypothetical protein
MEFNNTGTPYKVKIEPSTMIDGYQQWMLTREPVTDEGGMAGEEEKRE